MMGQTTQLMLRLDPGPDADEEEMEKLTRQLREDLLASEMETVDLVASGEIPQKAKAGDPIAWGTLFLTLAASGGVLTTLINALQSWLTRHDRHRLSLEIGGDKLEVTGISSEEQRRLIEVWLSRHKGGGMAND